MICNKCSIHDRLYQLAFIIQGFPQTSFFSLLIQSESISKFTPRKSNFHSLIRAGVHSSKSDFLLPEDCPYTL